MRLSCVVLLVLCLSAGPAAGKPVVGRIDGGVSLDWTRGALVARGAAPGDLRAPTPAVARTKARRMARKAAMSLLAKAVPKVPVQGTDAALSADAAEALVANARVVDEIHGSDGSSVVTMALGLDALRAALFAPDAAGNGSIDALVVDARKVHLSPVVGLELLMDGSSYRGPVLYFASRKEALRDGRVGKRRKVATAVAATKGSLTLKGISKETLDEARQGSALVVVVLGKGKR